MVRYGFLFEKVVSIDNILEAIRLSSRHKKRKRCVQRVLEDPMKYALEIQRMLCSGNIDWGMDHYKVVYEPSSRKERHVTIPSYYPDQIIHWAIMIVMTPFFMKGMVTNCIGSVPGRGPLLGKKRIEKALRRDKKCRYVEKMDIHHFFPSVNVCKLKELLVRKFKDKRLLAVCFEIIDRGEANPLGGLPIGYYTSQWFSNFYLEKADHFVSEKQCPRYYFRYVDDIVMMDPSKRKLHKARKALQEYFEEECYSLRIKGNHQLFKTFSRPLDFLGYAFFKGYTRLRKRLFFHLCRAARSFAKAKTVAHARTVSSLLGWLWHIGGGKSFYLNHMKRLAPKKEIASILRAQAC